MQTARRRWADGSRPARFTSLHCRCRKLQSPPMTAGRAHFHLPSDAVRVGILVSLGLVVIKHWAPLAMAPAQRRRFCQLGRAEKVLSIRPHPVAPAADAGRRAGLDERPPRCLLPGQHSPFASGSPMRHATLTSSSAIPLWRTWVFAFLGIGQLTLILHPHGALMNRPWISCSPRSRSG